MRIFSVLKADVKFQFKQGFYAVYILLTLAYMIAMEQIPDKLQSVAVPLIVFSDPTVVGFFFIGGIVMLEKVQGILDYLVVTPLRSSEYLASKVISLSMLAVAAGTAITAVTYDGEVNWFYLVTGTVLTSIFFTLYGFLATVGCRTINKYFLKSLPYMLLIIVPCFAVIGFKYDWIFNIFPSLAGLRIVFAAFKESGSIEAMLMIPYMTVFDVLLFWYVRHTFDKKIVYGGE